MVTYFAVHERLKRERGKASEHCCTCGAPARDWAYQGTTGEEKIEKYNGRKYSENLGDYLPMCRSCHLKLDIDDRRTAWSPEALERYRAGVKKGATVNARRRRKCVECDMTTHPTALGRHQKASGHRGWEEI